MKFSLLAGAIALAFSNPQEASTPTTFTTGNPYVEKLSCDGGSGTGFKLDTGQWVTVFHVARLGGCTMDGKPITVTYADPQGDFVLFKVDDHRKGGIPLDCGGFQNKRWYFGVGHAGGYDYQTIVTVMAENALAQLGRDRGWAVLIYSRFIPGQSGGVVLSQEGKAVGTVNAFNIFYPISYSRPLKDTVVCQG